MTPRAEHDRGRRWAALGVAAVVLAAQLALVALAGTEAPFYDQWGIEGARLYPHWLSGAGWWTDLFTPCNEHRIAWTLALDLGLFAANGAWDPLVQLVVAAGLRAAVAGGIAWLALGGVSGWARRGTAVAVAAAFLPVLAWHGVLWGFETQVGFGLGFSVAALALLGAPGRTTVQTAGGLAAGGAALVAMGAGALGPVALLAVAALRAVEARRIGRETWREIWPAVGLGGAAWALRVEVAQHAGLQPEGLGEFFAALGRLLAWPNGGGAAVAVAMNLPLALVVAGRLGRRRVAAQGEDFVLLLGGWSAAVAVATAAMRGGSAELAAGVPSRYADLLVLLPLANLWAAMTLAREAAARWRRSAWIVAAAWGVFLFAGWLGLSAEMWRGVIGPRMRDREAPVRLLREFQQTGDAAVFAGQPRLVVPAPELAVVRAVLADPRMQGKLPPALQPERPRGPLSRAVRWLLGRQ